MFWRFGLIERQPPGRGDRLREGRVQPAVVADVRLQRLEVGLRELGQLAELLDLGDDRVLVADRLQHARVGGEARLAAPLARQPELLEQDLAELLRRADDELLVRRAPRSPARGSTHCSVMRRPTLVERGDVELDALRLHEAQDAHERQLDVVQQVDQAALGELLALAAGQLVDQRRLGGDVVVGRRPPSRAPRPARAAGSRAARGRAGRRRSPCRRRGSAGTASSALASWAMTGRSPAAATSSAGSGDLAGQRGALPAPGAEAPALASAASSSPSGTTGASAASASSSPGQVGDVAPTGPRVTGSATAVCRLGPRDLAPRSSRSSSASSSRRSGSRSSKSRKISRSRERSGDALELGRAGRSRPGCRA